MKVTYNWLKDFVEIKIPPEALAQKLTMAGLEVKSIEEKGGDFVFEIEITSNRPDWLSVMGIAREVAALTGKRLKTQVKKMKPATCDRGHLAIKIEDKKDCPFYSATIIKGVTVGPSPEWLKKRLELVGCRSINNVVDSTNYILFETGQPLHAFDLDKLGSLDTIIVRRAKNQEALATIDGIMRTLDERVLVIASGAHLESGKPVALAGVMGGKDTEVDERTKNILLEAAVFNPLIVRRGRQAQGIQSESSYRFERGVDNSAVVGAVSGATILIQKLAGGSCCKPCSAGASEQKKKIVVLDIARTCSILGVEIRPNEIKDILTSLGCKIKPAGKSSLKAEIPFFRQDIFVEVDLIEEVARIYGYENIPVSLPKVCPQIDTTTTRRILGSVRDMLLAQGLNEAITYSLVDKKWLSLSKTSGVAPLSIANPLSSDQEVLRTTLIPSLLKAVAYNFNQKQEYVALFEIAKVFGEADGGVKERLVLGIALSGVKSFWLTQGRIKEKSGLLQLKGVVEVLLGRLGIKEYQVRLAEGDSVELTVQGKHIGKFARAGLEALQYFDIKNNEVYVAELSLDELLILAATQKKFLPLPLYPGITRDLSCIITSEIRVDDIVKALESSAPELLCGISIADCYKGKQIPAGAKGVTFSCLYRSNERTLTDAEITPLHAAISKIVAEKFNAQLR